MTLSEDAKPQPFVAAQADSVVALAIRAWEPVFASFAEALGPALYRRMYPDWRSQQEQAVRDALSENETFTVESRGLLAGFVNLTISQTDRTGEIYMIAVEPECQRRGLALELTNFATDVMRERGATLAVVSTGGDPGHLPARRTYERAGFAAFPLAAYHKLL